ncbi:hypothetical protein, partial [Methylomonas koyamae]|uniref:hypothetical protein n=1 Tax=Methylomonas koyamae TaxID=702114 RepID=UPI00210F95B4
MQLLPYLLRHRQLQTAVGQQKHPPFQQRAIHQEAGFVLGMLNPAFLENGPGHDFDALVAHWPAHAAAL